MQCVLNLAEKVVISCIFVIQILGCKYLALMIDIHLVQKNMTVWTTTFPPLPDMSANLYIPRCDMICTCQSCYPCLCEYTNDYRCVLIGLFLASSLVTPLARTQHRHDCLAAVTSYASGCLWCLLLPKEFPWLMRK